MRLASWLLLFWSLTLGAAEPRAPASLAEWRDWVLHSEPWRTCPFFADQSPLDETQVACVLPGATTIRIDGDARIESEVWLYASGYVPLIGAERSARDLTVNGTAAVLEGTRTWLAAGRYTLTYVLPAPSGGFESLQVPDQYRLIQLLVDGSPVFPLNREGTTLWLSRAEIATERDALELEVHRLWSDRQPQQLTTQLTLHVAGKAREIRLGPAWPEDFELMSIGGDLPAIVEPDRRLRVQATAGSYAITIEARALAPGNELRFDFPSENWPDTEVWSFAANSRLRVVDVTGAAPIDPAQASVPDAWRAFPAFTIQNGDAITLTERSRGLGQGSNRLTLNRDMWLDFDGGGYTVVDRLSGSMRERFRLDLATPFVLTSASERGEPLLVTGTPDNRGIEVRYPSLDVSSTARIGKVSEMPAHGWSERLDALSINLNLPPGYRLLHASGPDASGNAWIAQWSIYTVFIAAFVTVLAWRVGGLMLALGVGALAVFGAHEPDVPRYSLIALLLTLLALRALPTGRLRSLTLGLSAALSVLFVLLALSFAVTQARYALHPQLASSAIIAPWQGQSDSAAAPMPGAPPPPPPPPPPTADAYQQNVVESAMSGIDIERSRVGRKVERYAKDAVIQAGNARPTWTWASAWLRFDGPIAKDQSLRLWLSPPWMTSLWRWLLVVALAWIALHLWRTQRPSKALLAALALIMSPAHASDIPSPEMLTEYHTRLTAAPACVGQCASIPEATAQISGERFVLTLDVHAAERVLVPLPLDDTALANASLSIDGAPAPLSGEGVAPFERGVHRAVLSGDVRGERIALDFDLPPGSIAIDAPGWTIGGVRDGRLLANRLELVREAAPEGGGGSALRVPIKPFVRVVRELRFELDWTVETHVERIAPIDGGLSVRVPLLDGEQLQDTALKVEDGAVEIPLPPGEQQYVFTSRLGRLDSLSLTAPDQSARSEIWRIVVGPSFSLTHAGVPASEPENGINESEMWVSQFQPLPDETLTLKLSRPAAVPGATMVADALTLATEIGKRTRTHTLRLTVRATQGGSHTLRLPPDAELLSLDIDGQTMNLRPDKGALGVPIKPGTQTIALSWREDAAVSMRSQTPALDIGMEVANVNLSLALPADRWVLRLAGPVVGPAVLYWSTLIVLLAIGYGLGRSGRALLGVRDWLLLVIGFSAVSLESLLVVMVAFVALDARQRYLPGNLRPWQFSLAQMALGGWVALAFIAIVVSIPFGLLGSPDMLIEGNRNGLNWLADRSTSALPQASAWSVSLWWYKALMLAFALWLAASLVRWIKLAWTALNSGGGWPTRAADSVKTVDAGG